MSRSYISANGRIVAYHRVPSFDLRRLLFLLLLIIVCITTNPSNKFVPKLNLFTNKSAPIVHVHRNNALSSWNRLWQNLIRRFSNVDDIKYTNYILFSLRRRFSTVDLVVFSKNISICTINGGAHNSSRLCRWFGKTIISPYQLSPLLMERLKSIFFCI